MQQPIPTVQAPQPPAPKLGGQRATTMNKPPAPQSPLSTGTSKLEPGQMMMLRQKVAAKMGAV